LIRHVWPKIRQQLPTATLHIHGAYCTSELHQAAHNNQNKNNGISVHGFTPKLQDIFRHGSILLAPLRFGAGIKGKIVDAWTFGMPVVTTPIGSEGMTLKNNNNTKEQFGGRVASTLDEFCSHAIELAVDRESYQQAQLTGQRLLEQLYHGPRNWEHVQSKLEDTQENLTNRRQSDYTRAMLWHHSNRSTEYFSRWVELKEQVQRRNNNEQDPNNNSNSNK
jgi:glycosyltransferase involved in cell wall biosynthesis